MGVNPGQNSLDSLFLALLKHSPRHGLPAFRTAVVFAVQREI